MRNHLMGWILALLAALALSPVLHAQTAVQAGAATAQAAAPTPDLSGLLERLRDPEPSSINLNFGKNVSPMTPWAAAKFKAANAIYRGSNPNTVLDDPIF